MKLFVLLFFCLFISACAADGWQKFSPNTLNVNSSQRAPSTVKQQPRLEVFIFADKDQPAMQQVIDI